ncbi:MAG: hypothetical protein JF616_03825 [Fibrobacteres bacterium]|nr:hypothetical protein [Fibrobacterota bacterium]
MKIRTRLALLLPILVLAAGPVSAQTSGYSFTPATVLAGRGFDLHLSSREFNCATGFSNLKSTVTGTVILLEFLPQQRPAICVDTTTPYGPSFSISGLPAGTYSVQVGRLDMNGIISAGSLTVVPATHPDWYLKEHSVASGRPFTLQLLRDDIGNCQTGFSYDSLRVYGNSIFVTFLRETDPNRVCVMDIRPFGPSFAAPALDPGIYPVLPQELAACQVAQPPCVLPVLAPFPTDTLVVTHTLAVSLSALRAAAPKVELLGKSASFALPEGKAGIWRTDLMSLDGRILATESFPGAPGERVSVPVGDAPANAVSLLRLTSPDGLRSLMPVIR